MLALLLVDYYCYYYYCYYYFFAIMAPKKAAAKSCGRQTGKKGPPTTLSVAQRQEIKESFDLADADGSGTLDSKQVKWAMRAIGFEPIPSSVQKAVLASRNNSSSVAKAAGNSSSISSSSNSTTLTKIPELREVTATMQYDEYYALMRPLYFEGGSNEDRFKKAFRLFDDDETGKISFKNLKRVVRELGERMPDEEIHEMMRDADRDGDGGVSEAEFLQVIKGAHFAIQ